MTNKEIFEQFYKQAVTEGCDIPDAYALTELIKHSIKTFSYVPIDYELLNAGHYDPFEIVVCFPLDPRFGFVREDDGEWVHIVPTGKGNVGYYM